MSNRNSVVFKQPPIVTEMQLQLDYSMVTAQIKASCADLQEKIYKGESPYSSMGQEIGVTVW